MLEAIPETADVVAPPDARHQPRFTARWWRLSMPAIAEGCPRPFPEPLRPLAQP
jgi:hypothetical protein